MASPPNCTRTILTAEEAPDDSAPDGEFPLSAEAFRGFQQLIYEAAGVTVADTKRALVIGRLAARVRALGLDDFLSYYRYVSEGNGRLDGELQHCIDRLTTNETYFFRESRHFDFLRQEILPHHRAGRPFRVWSAASSTGEEAYTVAMVLADALGLDAPWEIFATDISTRVLETARHGIYPEQRARGVPDDIRRRFLLRGTNSQVGNVCVAPELRRHVRFEHYNLIKSPRPADMFDLILCRNVLIYFDPPTKTRVVEQLCASLHTQGYFFTGHSESLYGLVGSLAAIRPSIYRKGT